MKVHRSGFKEEFKKCLDKEVARLEVASELEERAHDGGEGSRR